MVALDYKKRQCGIYCIRHRGTGKFYIGSSVYCYHRIRSQHYVRLRAGIHTNPHLQSAWNLYGESSFDCFIIEECDQIKLLVREQAYLDHSGCTDPKVGYNINHLADRTVLTPEQCKKISESKKGIPRSEETRKKIGEAGKGRKWTEQQREKMLTARVGQKRSEETKQRLRDSWVIRKQKKENI
jgi:group I intron endonuclease